VPIRGITPFQLPETRRILHSGTAHGQEKQNSAEHLTDPSMEVEPVGNPGGHKDAMHEDQVQDWASTSDQGADLSALPPGGDWTDYVAAVGAASDRPSSIRSRSESLHPQDIDLIATRVIQRLRVSDAGGAQPVVHQDSGARDVPLFSRLGRQIQNTHRMPWTQSSPPHSDVTRSETLPIYEE
jgi:hypothetical protein